MTLQELKTLGPIGKLDKLRQVLEDSGKTKEEAYDYIHELLEKEILCIQQRAKV